MGSTPASTPGRILVAGLLALCAASLATASERSAEVLRQARRPVLDPSAAVELRGVELVLGQASIAVDRGVLIPTEPIAGRVAELLFVGQARFRLEPPDEIEAGQLELFTGESTIDTALEAAVLVVADAERVRSLLERQAPHELSPALLERAQTIHAEWLERAARRAAGVPIGAFKALIGDPAFRTYFAVWCRSYELGDFIYELDPENLEPLTLASFSPIEVQGWDRRRLERHLRVQQRKGRWLGLRLEDFGAWDIWLSSPWTPQEGVALPGNTGFEAQHYELDVTILRDKLKLDGTARLRIEALEDGRLAVTLSLFRDLVVRSVRDDEGRELFFFRSGKDLVVELAEPSRAGEELLLEIEYGGRALEWVGKRSYDLSDTSGWYPHCGSIDRATYDLTIRWPKKHDLIASGKRVDHGRRGRYLWERRVLDRPAMTVSFVLGKFEVERFRVGPVDVELAMHSGAPIRWTEAVRSELIATLRDSMEFFSETFGPYPLDHLTVATLPRKYSQSLLGYITLAESVVPADAPSPGGEMTWIRASTVAHELAHQWWGNLVGWFSYRDQWLSEAMANYSALLWYSRREGAGSSFLAEMSGGWRESLGSTSPLGRPVESLGPVVLGVRLNSSLAGNGYRAIVYRKGAVVLAMLARAVGEEPFLEMLRSLAEAASDRVLTTENFLAAMERMSGLELDGFARRYIYGTGIPLVYYDWTATPQEPGWVVRGSARLVADPRWEQRIVRFTDGRWDVERWPVVEDRNAGTALMVPFRLTMESEPGADGRESNGSMARHGGRLFLEGGADRFEIEAPARPVSLSLDPRGEILARFYSSEMHPKHVARFRAAEARIAGRADEAERLYREALDAPLGPVGERAATASGPDSAQRRDREDVRIRLALARLYVDVARFDEAAAELDLVDVLVEEARMEFRMERDALRARLEMRAGDHEAAFRRLKKALRLAAPGRHWPAWQLRLWQLQVSQNWLATTDVYALLALAAYETGNAEELRWALEGARDRGVDVSALEQVIGGDR